MSLVDTFFNADIMMSSLPALLRGFLNTLLLGLMSIGIGILIGLAISLVRLYAPKPLRLLAIGYTDIFRALPVLVVLILIYYALPFLGIRLSSWASAITAFAIIMSAYSAEVFRAGIESIPRGQFEAAQALGLPFLLTLRKVVLPQAVRVVIPPMTSNCVSMFKDTSLATVIGYNELMRRAMELVLQYGRPLEVLLTVGCLYFIICFPISKFSEWIERRLARNGA